MLACLSFAIDERLKTRNLHSKLQLITNFMSKNTKCNYAKEVQITTRGQSRNLDTRGMYIYAQPGAPSRLIFETHYFKGTKQRCI